MTTSVLIDPEGLFDSGPVYIAGAGEFARRLLDVLSCFPNFNLAGVFDRHVQIEYAGMTPKPLRSPIGNASLIIGSAAFFDEIRDQAEDLGWENIIDVRPLLDCLKTPVEIHDVSDLVGSKSERLSDNMQAAQIGLTLAVEQCKRGDLEVGFHRIRTITKRTGFTPVYDDVAGCAWRDTGANIFLSEITGHAIAQKTAPKAELRNQQEMCIERHLPPVLINTMIKSGTGFLTEAIRTKFKMPQYFISIGGSPNDYIIPQAVQLLARGGAFAVQHLDPSKRTLDELYAAGVRKIYLHVRDPRQATVSYIHHLENNLVGPNQALRNWVQPFLPHDYNLLSWEDKVEWNAKNHFPSLVNWTLEWLDVADNDTRFDIHVGSFEAFARDELGTINTIFDFFGLPDHLSIDELPKKDARYHFRKGATDEWRDVFSPRRQALMSQLLSDELRERMGW